MSSSSFQRASPVLLSSSCIVKNNSTNGPDYTQLAYPFRKAVIVDEIRFDLNAVNSPAFSNAYSSPELGAVVFVKLQFGRHYMMRDYVPIWLLGTAMSGFVEGNVDSSLSAGRAYSHYRWKLPEPLYLEAGQVLRSQFSRSVDALSGIPHGPTQDITVQVSYVGRVVPPSAPRPKTVSVPYVGKFVTSWGSLTYQQSKQHDLFNPFDRALRVQRMTGRVLLSTGLGGIALTSPKVLTPDPANGAGIVVQMFDSWGGKIVNDQTGPSDVWDATRDAWTFDTVLPAKGQYDVRVWNLGTGTQVHVGMVGVREEAL